MNASAQQRILQGLMQAADAMVSAGGQPTVPGLYLDFLPPEFRDRARDFFTYNVTFLTIAGGAAANVDTAIQNDSDFLLVAIAGTAVDPANLNTQRAFSTLTIAIQDSGSGRQLQNQATGFNNIVGTGQLPCYLPYPKFFDAASTITTTVTNLVAGQATQVRLAYLGFKIFGFAQGT